MHPRRVVDVMTLGRQRRQRRMMRLLRELDEIDAGRVRHGSASRRALGGTARVAATALVVVLGLSFAVHREYGVPLSLDALDRLVRGGTATTTGNGGAHAFLQTDNGLPVTYNPCRKLGIVVNDALAPPGADGLLEEAAARVAEETGLRLAVTGTTDETYSSRRSLRQPERYGDGWAPILVAWTTPDDVGDLAGDIAGIGGSAAAAAGLASIPRYVTGAVALDTPALTGMLARPSGDRLVRAILMHELAHVVGLDHVDDPTELMHETNLGVTDFGPGDREGLAILGSASCL